MKTYVITGANRGIGLEYCKQLKSQGENVIAIVRQPSSELKKLGITIESGIDITSAENVKELAHKLRKISIDVLINNAGIIDYESLDNLDFSQILQQFEVNALGTLRITHALLGNFKEGSKIIIMTSRMGSIEDNTSGGYYGYRMSKAAVSMAGKSLAEDLKSRKIAVGILHPGLVSTRMTNFSGISPRESVRNLLTRIEQLSLETTGTFWHANGEILPW
jgi:short-subunit dehydrogenase